MSHRRSLVMFVCTSLLASGLALSFADVQAETPKFTPAPGPAPIAFATGAELFTTNCTACHGAKGDGDGPAAPGLEPKPRKLSSKDIMSKLSDDQIAKAIKLGGAAVGKSPIMPAWTQFSDADVKNLVAHIRSLCGCKYTP